MAKKSIDKSISISNRKARFEYELLEVFTAGIQTTLEFGAFVMGHEAFTSGNFDTHFVKK